MAVVDAQVHTHKADPRNEIRNSSWLMALRTPATRACPVAVVPGEVAQRQPRLDTHTHTHSQTPGAQIVVVVHVAEPGLFG